MKITLVFVGKTVQQEVSSLTDDYISRIKGTDVSVKIVPNLKKKYPIEIQKTEEGREILKTVDKDDYVVLLDDKGKVFSSLDFASWLEKRQIHNRSVRCGRSLRFFARDVPKSRLQTIVVCYDIFAPDNTSHICRATVQSILYYQRIALSSRMRLSADVIFLL